MVPGVHPYSALVFLVMKGSPGSIPGVGSSDLAGGGAGWKPFGSLRGVDPAGLQGNGERLFELREIQEPALWAPSTTSLSLILRPQ
jgi:hypothetical protein